jgi:hypothetical protein
MATVNEAHTVISDRPQNDELHVWTPLTSANAVGRALLTGQMVDRTVQIGGTPDSATLVIQGSNDNVTWFTLTEPDGTALSFNAAAVTAGALKQIAERTIYTRPSTSGGGGSQSVTVQHFGSRFKS